MDAFKVGILGATGAVGREMLLLLQERAFPLRELRLFASPQSEGKRLRFYDESLPVSAVSSGSFNGLDLVLGAADAAVAGRCAQDILRAGALFVDNSSAFRLSPDIPLVIPEINPQAISAHHGIIASPNCTTIISLTAIYPLHRVSPLTSLIASSYQAVSGAGTAGLTELDEQIRSLSQGKAFRPSAFPYQIAYNVIPHIGEAGANGYTSEELKLQNEGRKILAAPSLQVSCTCARVPVQRSHSVSLRICTREKIPVEHARRLIAAAPGCRLIDDPTHGLYPMPLDTSEQDLVYAGRIRADQTNPNGLLLWVCGDQLRKGAATNAIQIAESALGVIPALNVQN